MRRRGVELLIGAAASLLVPLLAARRRKKKRAEAAEPGAADERPAAGTPGLASSVEMGDAEAAHQLISGFHEIEDGAWRWTEKRFVLKLAAPDKTRAVFRLDFTIPEVAARHYGTQRVALKIGSTAPVQREFSSAGSHEFTAEVPAAELAGNVVELELSLDKAFTTDADDRELGVIVQRAALSA